jgi:hypothetical protein
MAVGGRAVRRARPHAATPLRVAAVRRKQRDE